MTGLDREIAAYDAKRAELEARYLGKWVVFHGGAMIGAFDDFDTAAREAVSRFGAGPYLLRQVGAPDLILPASVMYQPA